MKSTTYRIVFFTCVAYLSLVNIRVSQSQIESHSQLFEALRLIDRAVVREDLHLTEDQCIQIHALATDSKLFISQTMRRVDSLPLEDRRSAIDEMNRELTRRAGELDRILSQGQIGRLHQLLNQLRAGAHGSSAGLLNQFTVRELDLSSSQQDEIKRQLPEIERRLRDKQDELRRQFVEFRNQEVRKLLNVLSEEQRRAYQKMYGKVLDIDSHR